MADNDRFLGHPFKYWVELDKRLTNLLDKGLDRIDFDRLINEIINLRAKVSFYESRINELSKFMELKKE